MPGKPSASGESDSHGSFRYSYRHSLRHALRHSFRYAFSAHGALPYPCISACRGFGSVLEPRSFSAQRLSASELLRTLSMLAASEPTSWLSSKRYILSHLVRHSGPWPAVRAVSLSSAGLITRALTPVLRGGGIRSLKESGRLYAPSLHQRSTAPVPCTRPALKLFRGEPAISAFDWHFTPMRNSSQSFSTLTSSVLHPLLPGLQPGRA